jgi:hypothetical protein
MNLPPVCQQEGRASGELRPDPCHLFAGQYVLRPGQDIPSKKGQQSGHCSLPLQDKNQVLGFAFSHLLGFRLLPPLKPIHSQRLALVEAGTQDDYPHLKEVLGKPINWEAIT